MISDNSKEKLKANTAEITRLLAENENILREEGLNPPANNFSLESSEKINIPSSYIRVNEYFIKKYHLREIVSDAHVRKNMAYTLQLSDLNNYLINRFFIWGSVETMFLKSAIINLVSVLEALIFECVNNICCCTNTCGKANVCNYHFTNKQRNNSAFDALQKLNEINITRLGEDELSRVQEIINYRNHVHIRLAKDNEYLNSDFSIETYNELMLLLAKIDGAIFENGVPLYNCGGY